MSAPRKRPPTDAFQEFCATFLMEEWDEYFTSSG